MYNSYAQTLRLIGQDLHDLHLEKFELEISESAFIVRGEIVVAETEPQSSAPEPKTGFFPGLWKPKRFRLSLADEFKQSNDAIRPLTLNVLQRRDGLTLMTRSLIFTSRANSCA